MLLGDGDPPDSCKCKKVSRTKTAEQKWRNKNYSLFRVTQTKIGGDSASAKRSAEQKLVGTVGHWVTGTPSASAKRSAEQKLRNKNWWGLLAIGWQIAEQKLWNKNSRTKIVEQKLRNKNWWGLLAIGWRGPQVQVQKGQWNKNCKGTKFWHFGYFSKEPIQSI